MLDNCGQDNPISFREEVTNVQWTKIDRNWSLESCDLNVLNVELLI